MGRHLGPWGPDIDKSEKPPYENIKKPFLKVMYFHYQFFIGIIYVLHNSKGDGNAACEAAVARQRAHIRFQKNETCC